ncbi:MAG TPA: GNAT family N-acetyltransferase [Gaiellaceae bacterium]|jgi:ribosomal protein S18 acetylase RimI-like enzyme|nr:GNAT family N-acetyltransferase [Gaiellaceae bacterium]
MRVEVVQQADDELVEAMALLVPQLSTSATPPGIAELMEIAATPSTRLLVARDDTGSIVGTLTLLLDRTPTGVGARIEAVVVDRAARGQGVGEALTREAIRLAELGSARSVDLTSRPEREAADRLYRRLGFEPRDTHVYRLRL